MSHVSKDGMVSEDLAKIPSDDLVSNLRYGLGLNFIEIERCLVFIGSHPATKMHKGEELIIALMTDPVSGKSTLKANIEAKLGIVAESVWGERGDIARLFKTVLEVYAGGATCPQ